MKQYLKTLWTTEIKPQLYFYLSIFVISLWAAFVLNFCHEWSKK